jgi:transcription initiation factor IIE alpha subunit
LEEFLVQRRFEKINTLAKDLAEEAFKAYSGKRDYKRAIEIYCILAEYICIPEDISNFSKNMLGNLSKKIEDNT